MTLRDVIRDAYVKLLENVISDQWCEELLNRIPEAGQKKRVEAVLTRLFDHAPGFKSEINVERLEMVEEFCRDEATREILLQYEVLNPDLFMCASGLTRVMIGSADLDGIIGLPIDSARVTKILKLDSPESAYGFVNQNQASDSIAYADFSNEIWRKKAKSFNADLLACFLKALCDNSKEFKVGKYIVTFHENNNVDALPALKLHLLASGHCIHTQYDGTYGHGSKLNQCISASDSYDQFEELFQVLSEANSRTEIVSRFLSLYHVIENFMYRQPIVSLTAQPGMFSVRTLKTLYDKVRKNEFDSLKTYIKSVWDSSVDGQNVGDFIHNRFVQMASDPIFDQVEFETLKNQLGVGGVLNRQSANNGGFKDVFFNLLYKTRCAIVHNKETEYHISGPIAGEDRIVSMLLEDFLVPTMEFISYGSLLMANSPVRYSRKTIALYQ